MGYIWEHYSLENYYRIATEGVSPYTEVWESSGKDRKVNVLYRLEELFFPEEGIADEETFRRWMERYEEEPRYQALANLLFHYQAQMDRKSGIGRLECLIEQNYTEILQGAYGMKFREKFVAVDKRRQFLLLKNLALYDEKKQRETMLDATLKEAFGLVRLYYEKSTGILHVYIDQEETAENRNLYEVICYLFQDIGTKLEVMWKGQHFGILGVEEVMKVGEISIY